MKTFSNYFLKRTQGILLLSLTLFIFSCDKKEENLPTGAYETGIFIVNEGPYASGTGTITHFDHQTKSATQDIFEKENSYPLGNIVQSMNVINDKAYIVVNNANKIEIADAKTFKSIGVINGLNQPRYILPIDNNTAYVSQWGNNGSVKVIDLNTNSVTNTITTGKGPEKMVLKGNKVYVACKGGLGNDSIISVININTQTVSTTIKVGPNPESIIEDANGSLWVLCTGMWKSDYSALEKPGKLVKVNPTTNTVEFGLDFASSFSQPSGLVMNSAKTKLYYSYDGKIQSQAVSDNTLSNTVVINKGAYGLGIDPTNNTIYLGDAGNFSSNGKVYRYQSNGTAIDTISVGVAPNSFYFKK